MIKRLTGPNNQRRYAWAVGTATLAIAVLATTGCGSTDQGGGSSHTTTQDQKPAKTSAAKPSQDDRSDVDKRSRAYLNAMSTCETAVGLVLLDLKRGKLTDIELSDEVTQAADVCDTVRSRLAGMDTDHFDNEAALGFYAIDRYKSGLNAMHAYIDNPRPSKVVEARDKLRDGDASAREAERQINGRRHVHGLKSYHP